MRVNRSFTKTLYIWIRDLHLYLGLFISPYIIVFAVSTMLLNHSWMSEPEAEVRKAHVELTPGLEAQEQGFQVLEQLGLKGELQIARMLPNSNTLAVNMVKPGERTRIEVDTETGEATVERRETGALDAMIYMHMTPGPHRPRSMINWVYTKIWSVLTDATVYLLIFLSLSGIYMWLVLKSERKAGWIATTAGLVSFVFIMAGFFWG